MGEKIEKCMLYMYYFCANCEIVEKLVCSTYDANTQFIPELPPCDQGHIFGFRDIGNTF